MELSLFDVLSSFSSNLVKSKKKKKKQKVEPEDEEGEESGDDDDDESEVEPKKMVLKGMAEENGESQRKLFSWRLCWYT